MVDLDKTYSREEHMELHKKYVEAHNAKGNFEHKNSILTEKIEGLEQEIKELQNVVINQSKELHG